MRSKVKDLLLLANEMFNEDMYTMAVHNASLALYTFLEILHLEIYGAIPVTRRLKSLIITLAPTRNIEVSLKKYVDENSEFFEKLELAYRMSLASELFSKEEATSILKFVNKTIRFLSEIENLIRKSLQ